MKQHLVYFLVIVARPAGNAMSIIPTVDVKQSFVFCYDFRCCLGSRVADFGSGNERKGEARGWLSEPRLCAVRLDDFILPRYRTPSGPVLKFLFNLQMADVGCCG